jgi:hypothetical protein
LKKLTFHAKTKLLFEKTNALRFIEVTFEENNYAISKLLFTVTLPYSVTTFLPARMRCAAGKLYNRPPPRYIATGKQNILVRLPVDNHHATLHS